VSRTSSARSFQGRIGRCPGLICGCRGAGSEADGNEDDDVCEQNYNVDVDVAHRAQEREDGAQRESCDGQVRHDGYAHENSSRGAPLGREVVPHEAEEEGWQELRDVGGTQEREEHQVQGVAEVNTRVTSATTGTRNFARLPTVSCDVSGLSTP
jgi:hypothetical protein